MRRIVSRLELLADASALGPAAERVAFGFDGFRRSAPKQEFSQEVHH
jgi:hypothetical protein